MSTYRFTTEDAERLNEEAHAEARAAIERDGAAAWLDSELERLGVDKEAIVSLGGAHHNLCAAVHLGLRIAEYQREREAEQQRGAVPA